MPFIILQNSTTADATDVNSNFYWVGQGSRLPLGGNNLEYTDSVYDLGSVAYTWNDLYCQNIYANSIANLRISKIIAETTLAASVSSIEFTGLNGDNYNNIRMIVKIDCDKTGGATIPALYITFNGDSGANYGDLFDRANDTVLQQIYTMTSNYIHAGYLGNTTGSGYFGNILLSSRSVFPKIVDIESMTFGTTNTATFIQYLITGRHIWNSTSTLTSIKLRLSSANMIANTHVQLWGS